MEEYYMAKIWNVISFKKNQNLTNKQQQDKIIEILETMKSDIETSAKKRFKQEVIDIIGNSLNAL